jgi:phytoene synthase
MAMNRALVLAAPDRAACRRYIRRHSHSFFLSSLLLPARVRGAAWALYAFCRQADDAIDESDDRQNGLFRVAALRRRLARVYECSDAVEDDGVLRAFAAVVRVHCIPRALPEALLDGMEMDARGIRYDTEEELLGYCFRVAATVGLMMTCVMGCADELAYLRAADLGVAMQLTNLARDVGEDARRGRVYLPRRWCAEVGFERDDWLCAPVAHAPLRAVVRTLLARADAHYRAADGGVPLLPRDCRFAIAASRHIYAGIGDAIVANGGDSVTRRAYVSLGGKLACVLRALPARWKTHVGVPAGAGPADGELRPLVRAVGLPA